MPTRTFKVKMGDNTVRLTMEVDTASQALTERIHAAAASAMDLTSEEAPRLVLKYEDNEKDMCTLTSLTLEDLLALVPEGAIRLTATLQEPLATQPTGTSMTAAQMIDSCREDRNAASSSAEAPLDPMSMMLSNMAAQHAHMWLPALAVKTQDEDAQQKITELGRQRAEQIVPACEKLLSKLGMLPELEPLVPELVAYIGAPHDASLGPFVSHLLQALASSMATKAPIVQELVRDAVSLFIPVMMTPHRATSSSDTPPQPGQDPATASSVPDLSALFGMFGGKGLGKGQHQQPGSPTPDLGTLLGGLLGKGKGKGDSSADGQTTPAAPVPDLGAMIGSVLAAKGGYQQQGPDLASVLGGLLNAKGSGKGVAAPVVSSTTCPIQEQSFEEEVADLLDMGLVSDPEVARDMLRQHKGDVSLVVASLTSE